MGILLGMKLKLLDYLDVLHSEVSPKLEAIEKNIAKYIDTNGLSTYFAHNISFYPESGEIIVSVYDCGVKADVPYIRKADSVIISTKPKLTTLVESKNTYTHLGPELRPLVESWSKLSKQLTQQ